MKRTMKAITAVLFSIYGLILICILFLGMRSAHTANWTYWTYIRRSFNPIPFKTIGEYLVRAANHTINISTVWKNLLGNMVLFMPMGFLLPCISPKRFNKFSRAVVTGILIIIGVECVQLFSTLGSFDIDDIILDSLGLTIGFLVFKCKPIQFLLKKLQILE